MACLGVGVALYAYAAQADDELSLAEGDALYLEDVVDDAWYRARRRFVNAEGVVVPPDEASKADEAGLVPANYVEKRAPIRYVQAVYAYTANGADELSIEEGQQLEVYEIDGEWLLAGAGGMLGLVPANYVEEGGQGGQGGQEAQEVQEAQTVQDTVPPAPAPAHVPAPVPVPMPVPVPVPSVTAPAPSAPILTSPAAAPTRSMPPPASAFPESDKDDDPQPTLDEDDGRQETVAPIAVPAAWTATQPDYMNDDIKMWSVTEMDPKKKKKRAKGTLGVGNASLFFATADTNGAAVPRINIQDVAHAELDKSKYLLLSMAPSAHIPQDTLQFHVGSKQAGEVIMHKIQDSKDIAVRAGSRDAAALRAATAQPSVLPPSQAAPHKAPARSATDQEMVVALYDFDAQDTDEMSVCKNDQLVLIERENDEWWKLQNAAGKVGVVPAAYVDILPSIKDEPVHVTPRSSQTSTVVSSMGKGASRDRDRDRDAKTGVRTWVDATGKFRVNAELLGVGEDHVRLHKTNGSVIDVPLSKMGESDLLYLEQLTGRRLFGRAAKSKPKRETRARRAPKRTSNTGKDWFAFLLEAGIDVDNCTRYAAAFERDHVDESIVDDLDPSQLRSLGLREGDIIRLRRFLERRSSANKPAPRSHEDEERRIREDESLARRLQAQEIAAERRHTSQNRVSSSTKRTDEPAEPLAPQRSSNEANLDAETIAAAVEIVRRREREEASARDDKAEREADANKPKEKTKEPKEAPQEPTDPTEALFDKLAGMKAAPKATPPDAGFNPMAPRGPFAPVLANQGLLQPLIPLQGTGQIVPTGTGMPNWSANMIGQPTGYASMGQYVTGMMPMATGAFPPPSPFQGGSMPQQPTGMQAPVLGAATAETVRRDDEKYSAANVFQQMKTGSLGAQDSAPQSSGKYDALRAQPTGFAAGGIVDPGPQPDMSPFSGGFMPGMQGMSTGQGMPGMYGAPTGGYMMPPGYYGV
ncbi:cytoskeletal protein binding protein [Malassezia vespertilionis]|uniref:Actin cytoskeleton-regulatory complex protein SLA1 n=1 Tax=Malassezia vespertilionis TaxID=2020962 RepID=A0A2N1J6Y3_9BASI|nr:cytoskeletal protein binding protein [Malassezia vespertilionis]PKI82318.1 Sla1p [Malassezia vespertilionis]WFD08155.1 cytoskeletal protein binding protein [Malassezia vespertilionis]